MIHNDNGVKQLLARTLVGTNFNEYIKAIAIHYPQLGDIVDVYPINEGYEDANFLLHCTNGKFVLKVFLSERSSQNIQDYVRVIEAARKNNVATLELQNTAQGAIFVYENVVKCIVTTFFEGSSFKEITPSEDDIINVVHYLSLLNELSFDITSCYDSWGSNNLISEFEMTSVKDNVVLQRVAQVVKTLKQVDFSSCQKSIIHGDMQRKHVLKHNGQYCIIDYGCMRFDYRVFDIATLIAWFVWGHDTWNQKDSLYQLVIDEYTKRIMLNESELAIIPALVDASYAAYYLKTQQLIEEGDVSIETRQWHETAGELLQRRLV